jgi:ABC-type Zn uptake system ZnuABC Zn-binding protein ZnuA
MIKNRQQSMLERAASEIGMDVTNTEYWNNLKKEPLSAGVIMYDRSRASLS